jgi:hypothetical protein
VQNPQWGALRGEPSHFLKTTASTIKMTKQTMFIAKQLESNLLSNVIEMT